MQLQQSNEMSAHPSDTRASPRGNVIKQPGQRFAITGLDGKVVATAVIESITPDATCSGEFSEPPHHGHYLDVSVELSTSPTAESYETLGLLSPNDFSIVKPDGVSETDLATMNSYTCLEAVQTLPDKIAPGQRYTGHIVLDTQVTRGTLVYRPGGFSTGAEWQFGDRRPSR